MYDYIEYIRVRKENKGVSIEAIMKEGGKLYNNSYAQLVKGGGKEAARINIGQAVIKIVENRDAIKDLYSIEI